MKKSIISLFLFLMALLFCSTAWAADGDEIKWRQAPDMRFGVNIASVEPRPLLADDWRCEDPRPVTDVHFWGSYIGWQEASPVPDLPPPGVEGFVIRIYSDVPAGVDQPYSHPGNLLYEHRVTDFEETYVASISRFDETFEHKFGYRLDLPEPFEQVEGTIYWISIAAAKSPTHEYLWGWETSSDHWNDNVVTGDGQDWKDIGAPPHPIIDFEDLVPATVYPVPAIFTSADVPITTEPFQWSSGTWTSGGRATVVNIGSAGGSGNELNLNNVNLDFGFWLPMLGLSLKFGKYGGNLNLTINGDFRNFENFDEINGLTIGGVTVAIVNGSGNDMGTLSLSGGPIAQFAIGGQELYIDDIAMERRADMAFALSVPYAPPPPLAAIKWQQRPDMVRGANLLSIANDASWVTVADDWLCLDGSPVADLHFWGSYPGWMDDAPDPGVPTPGVKAFRIQIFSDVPASAATEFSRPGKLLYEVWVEDFVESPVASILLPWERYEHKYRYDLDLPRPFWQRRDHIYWLNIAAVPLEIPWGWETSMDRWNDVAVEGFYRSPDDWFWDPVLHPWTEKYVDMAFELTTCNGPIKWLQFPDMADGINIVSLPDEPVVADDWLCTDGKPITEVHFWGSYLSPAGDVHWQMENPGPPQSPLPDPPRVDGFKLSFHRDVRAGVDPEMPWSHPGELIRETWIPASEVRERYWDSVPHTDVTGRTWWEHKFYYQIRLEDPFLQEAGTVYWLDIGAKPVDGSHWVWGWETSKDHWNDNAVRGDGTLWRNLGRRTSDFEDLAAGSTFIVGDTFASGDLSYAVRAFQWSNGVWTSGGHAGVVSSGMAGGTGNEINTNNVNLEFGFTSPLKSLYLLYGEYGGNVNIEINGDFRNFQNLSQINGATIGGVTVSVVNGFGDDRGTLTLTGEIDQFAIGGQEFFIDGVRAVRPADMAYLLITHDDIPYCRGDVDRNGRVNPADLSIFAADFGRADCYLNGTCEGDFTYDGDVDGNDLAVFAEEYGREGCPCPLP
jgi:hypothetical protein